MKVVLAGASGFLGTALADDLRNAGHQVHTLVRRRPVTESEFEWHPERGELDPLVLAGSDAVVCLSGAGVGDKRWTEAYQQVLVTSRVQPTSTIARTLAGLPPELRPGTFVSASAIGYYGERGDQPLPETATAGTGFLADLVRRWEAATEPAGSAGVRVAMLRTGLVLSARGGLMKRLVPIFKLGGGGKLGSGRQYQSWITLADEIGAIRHILQTEQLDGPVNLVGPEPVRNAEFSAELAKTLHRPSMLPAPAFALRLAVGRFADEGVLISQRVLPEKLLASGYRFIHADLPSALDWAVKN
ncbi:TIGR01777 family oxidoreductase [Jatrophihabitans sp.]|uniref:TIGR01777 family oxidoreductase n=1 Tax=Jatrophihabitans sp. TaxID=1932789 RepID=UPI002BC91C7D|nr:TIGR01777 family oxidoreductase [Jatrophihabitans sp.]